MDIILSVINSIIPKCNNIVFSSFPDVSGNSAALYEYIIKHRQDIINTYRLIWTINDTEIQDALSALYRLTGREEHIVVNKKSLKGIWYYFTSKYIISTHGYFSGVRTSKDQTHLNLWHGMPFKRIGKMLEEVHSNGKKDEADYTIATSPIYRKIMAMSFDIPEEKVLLTGQPVNDKLLSTVDSLKELGVDRSKYKYIIMWLPTYRKSIIGDVRLDGKAGGFGVSSILDLHLSDLQFHLKKNNYMLLIKPHPMDGLCKIKLSGSENIRIINNDELKIAGIQLYELLAQSDVLFTDYSSVFIDYLITGKPMAFICDDIGEYANSRGFCFEHPRDYMPGEFITDYIDFVYYIDHMEEINQKWVLQNRKIQLLFNSFVDQNASERVCNEIWGYQKDLKGISDEE